MPKTSVGKLVHDAQARGESLESLMADQVNIGKLVQELNMRNQTKLLHPDQVEGDRVSMLVAAWFKNKEVQV